MATQDGGHENVLPLSGSCRRNTHKFGDVVFARPSRALGPVKALSGTPKVLVVDLRHGTRHNATDELREMHRGTPVDADLVVFAVVGVKEELLRNYYGPRGDGFRLHITVAAVRWPQKEPLGLWVVQDDPPFAAIVREGEIPRGDVTWRVGHLIRELLGYAPHIQLPS